MAEKEEKRKDEEKERTREVKLGQQNKETKRKRLGHNGYWLTQVCRLSMARGTGTPLGCLPQGWFVCWPSHIPLAYSTVEVLFWR